MKPVKVFYSYAHEDETLRNELGKHLTSLRHYGVCEDWYDGCIEAGEEWDEEIKSKLGTADFILLLISADFLNSDYVRSVELEEAMQKHQEGQAKVVPIMLRECNCGREVFSKLQMLPKEGKAVVLWENQDTAWTDVVNRLETAFEKFRCGQPRCPETTGGSQDGRDIGPQEGLSHESLTITPTKGFHGLGELMTNPEIQSFVAEQQPYLAAADEKLQVLVDYKNVHDLLHDLQFKCFNYIYQYSRRLEDEIDWPLLVQPQQDLKSIIEALEVAARQPSLADEDFAWLGQLRDAQNRLDKACEDLHAAPLKESRNRLKGILEKWPTIFDTKLCAAAQTIPLNELQSALDAIREKLRALPTGDKPNLLETDAGERFSDGVKTLPELNVHLDELTTEHTRWQVIEARLWSIEAFIGQDPAAFRDAWPDLYRRIGKVCGSVSAKWATSIMKDAAKLDSLLRMPEPDDPDELRRWKIRVRQYFTRCSSEGGTRFYQVDLSLKRLCERLRSVHAALADILKKSHGRALQ